ncbi:MAG TPA: tetratricopeptide repeat protein [Vicinamibacterales bacterium]|nr:tetratricopeptide repeat protein [Vicinamibacterales bacterium]
MIRSVVLALALWTVAGDPAAAVLQRYEAEIAQQPENLVLASEYRQTAIAARDFDRPIKFFEKLGKLKNSGPNVQISLALALVDKAPVVGEVRRAYVGFDAISAVNRAIAQAPTVLAFYVRGRINLGYDKLIFHRTDKGVADLERALTLVTPATPLPMIARVYQSLGDGYYKLDELAKARQAWTRGLEIAPDDHELRSRVEQGEAVGRLVHDALSPSRRADTNVTPALLER